MKYSDSGCQLEQNTQWTYQCSLQSVPLIQNWVCLHTRFSFTYSWIVEMISSSLAFVNVSKCFCLEYMWLVTMVNEGMYLTYVLAAHCILHVADACFLIMLMRNRTVFHVCSQLQSLDDLNQLCRVMSVLQQLCWSNSTDAATLFWQFMIKPL